MCACSPDRSCCTTATAYHIAAAYHTATACLPPSHSADRLEKAWARESARFDRDYNDRLLSGLVMLRWVGGRVGRVGPWRAGAAGRVFLLWPDRRAFAWTLSAW